jgi:hypothetical protein
LYTESREDGGQVQAIVVMRISRLIPSSLL